MHFKKENQCGQGACSFPHAFKLFWVHYVDFTGHSTRSEYWWRFLWSFIIDSCLTVLMMITSGGVITQIVQSYMTGNFDDSSSIMTTLLDNLGVLGIVALIAFLWRLATFIPRWALQVRRFNDVGLPLWGSIALLVAVVVFGLMSMNGGTGSELLALITMLASFILNLMPSNLIDGRNAKIMIKK